MSQLSSTHLLFHEALGKDHAPLLLPHMPVIIPQITLPAVPPAPPPNAPFDAKAWRARLDGLLAGLVACHYTGAPLTEIDASYLGQSLPRAARPARHTDVGGLLRACELDTFKVKSDVFIKLPPQLKRGPGTPNQPPYPASALAQGAPLLDVWRAHIKAACLYVYEATGRKGTSFSMLVFGTALPKTLERPPAFERDAASLLRACGLQVVGAGASARVTMPPELVAVAAGAGGAEAGKAAEAWGAPRSSSSSSGGGSSGSAGRGGAPAAAPSGGDGASDYNAADADGIVSLPSFSEPRPPPFSASVWYTRIEDLLNRLAVCLYTGEQPLDAVAANFLGQTVPRTQRPDPYKSDMAGLLAACGFRTFNEGSDLMVALPEHLRRPGGEAPSASSGDLSLWRAHLDASLSYLFVSTAGATAYTAHIVGVTLPKTLERPSGCKDVAALARACGFVVSGSGSHAMVHLPGRLFPATRGR